MKRITVFLIMFIFSAASIFAQKYAFVDTEYILSNIPSYKAAQDQLDQLSESWQKEIENKYAEIDKLYKNYQAERVLLTDEMRVKREEQIIKAEQEIKKQQNDYFGQEGALFKKREELVKPIQDEIYNTIKELATENGYAVIFDSSSGPTMLYTNPRYDISDEVLQKLGYKN
ncbi:MAG: OmpH family outer membrane protein [Bacteroidales bacterium]|nr:OmpH family outer membrane protein [Bacteroidales bacterium]